MASNLDITKDDFTVHHLDYDLESRAKAVGGNISGGELQDEAWSILLYEFRGKAMELADLVRQVCNLTHV